MSTGDGWTTRAHEVVSFVSDHGFFPRRGWRDEHELAVWLCNQRAGLRRGATWLTPARIALLDEILPGWRPLSAAERSEQRFRARAAELGAFYREHGRTPRLHAEDPVERSLGVWFYEQRRAARRGKLDQERIRILDAQFEVNA